MAKNKCKGRHGMNRIRKITQRERKFAEKFDSLESVINID
jgi:hypothetical protein